MFRNNPITYLFRMTWRFSEGNRPKVVLFMVMAAIANLSSLLVPLILAKLLNVIQEQGIHEGNFLTLLFILSLFVVQILFFWVFHGPSRVMERNNAFLVRANYQRFLIDGVMGLPLSWHTDHHSGDTIDKVKRGSLSLFNFSGTTWEYIDAAIRFVGSLIAIAYFDLGASFIAILIVVIAVTILLRFDRILVEKYKELNKADNLIAAKIYDVISNITTAIILRVENLLSKEIVKATLKPFGLYGRTIALNEWKWFVVGAASATMFFFVIGSYMWGAIQAGDLVLVGTISALYGYVQRINGLFSRFAYLFGRSVRWRTDVANAEELSNEFITPTGSGKTGSHTDWKICKIEKLNFSYHPAGEETDRDMHLDDVEITLRRGEKIAVIGESGSGKTTLLKVMRGLYEPETVSVYLDGDSLASGFEDLSQDIALIPQDPEIFTATIRDNITIGIERTNKEIKKYTDLAQFSSVVERLPHGLDSHIVEKGVNLSGGEKQRLALARGLMASENKSIVLFDESTSSVDPENEAVIFERLMEEYTDKVVVASIHRLHLLRMFDTIYLFDRGKIIDRGTFDDLLSNSSKFQKMWDNYTKSQAKR